MNAATTERPLYCMHYSGTGVCNNPIAFPNVPCRTSRDICLHCDHRTVPVGARLKPILSSNPALQTMLTLQPRPAPKTGIIGTQMSAPTTPWKLVMEETQEGPAEKVGHFVWITRPDDHRPTEVKPNWFWAIYSFMFHHPSWKVILWTNCKIVGVLAEFLKEKGMEIRFYSESNIPAQAQRAYAGDWVKIHILYHHGGIISDITDTLTMRSFDTMWNKTEVIGYSKYTNVTNSPELICAGCIIVKRKGLKFFKDLLQAGNHDFETAMLKSSRLGWTEWSRDHMFPWSGDLDYLKYGVVHPYITDNTVQTHWWFTSNFDNATIKARRDVILAQAELTWDGSGNYCDILQKSIGVSHRRDVIRELQSRFALNVVVIPTLSELMKRAICITLPNRQDRRTQFMKNFSKFGFTEDQFFEGFVGKKMKCSWAIPTDAGTTGCTLSHAAILKMARFNNWPYVMIFEDDCLCSEAFAQLYSMYRTEVPSDCEVLMVGHYTLTHPIKQVSEHVYKMKSACGSHAVLVFKSAYTALIDRLDRFEVTTDHNYGEHKGAYTFYPTLCTQANGLSDITGTIRNLQPKG